ncbi:Cobalt-precorrin-5B C(1)-methyltransferase [Trichinella spiralis]|uniref:Cobalt-precorrin-5B C(1)-methyltransferase n=1 Tax=Trichinella spiralis TaxID=6334 RepID=A0ABR3K6H0_TRISP
MTAQSFLAAFRRFTARRGKPSVVQTDNFRTFKLRMLELPDMTEKRLVEKEPTSTAMTLRRRCLCLTFCVLFRYFPKYLTVVTLYYSVSITYNEAEER